jgi:hypothetical protein
VKGVGACGVYRLPRSKEEAEKELQEEKRIKKEKELKGANKEMKRGELIRRLRRMLNRRQTRLKVTQKRLWLVKLLVRRQIKVILMKKKTRHLDL